jgi:hypothetical protein
MRIAILVLGMAGVMAPARGQSPAPKAMKFPASPSSFIGATLHYP